MALTVAVTGATGSQGGAVVSALLESGADVKIRAVTRSAASDKAKALISKGVEIAIGDFDHADTLLQAFIGADTVFIVTNYWEHLDGNHELQQARNAFDAAKKANVKHIVFSTLESTAAALKKAGQHVQLADEKYPVPFYDWKVEAAQYLASLGVPYTLYYTSCYIENLLGFLPITKTGNGVYVIANNAAEAEIGWCSLKDIGGVGAAIILKGPAVGAEVGVLTEYMSFQDMAALVADITGKDISFSAVSDDENYQALINNGVPVLPARAFTNMFVYFRDCVPALKKYRSVSQSKELYPDLDSAKSAVLRLKQDLIRTMEAL